MQPDQPPRSYLLTTSERFRRHLRTNGSRAVFGGVSFSAVVAGFLDATNRQWPLLAYVGLAAGVTVTAMRAACSFIGPTPSKKLATMMGGPLSPV